MTTVDAVLGAWRSVHPEVILAVGLAAALYAWSARARPPAPARAASFVGGLAVLLATLNGPLHDLAEGRLFAAHMVQHLALTLVAPPLLLAGLPPWMADAVLAPVLRRPAIARLARALTRPLPALALGAVALVAWHLPGAHAAILTSRSWHAVAHLSLMGTAALAWWPILSPSRLLPPLPPAAQLLYLFAFGMPMTVVAAMITGAEHVLYPLYDPGALGIGPLEDQRLGGVIMWVPSGIVPLVAFTVVFFRWAAAEAEDA
ncbi:MAG TPA: cytochrome c oxidase assembly protein [Candidatus Tectomicrobia bacterium]|nr:cytochrome c oxidase assembly protein [Candidatus Tectomicrobia bacterium]